MTRNAQTDLNESFKARDQQGILSFGARGTRRARHFFNALMLFPMVHEWFQKNAG